MGGGGQANKGQATTAANQQTAANNQDMALSKQYGGQEADIFNRLFGKSGSLNGMMNPASLTQSGLNPAYKAQFNQGSDQLAQNYKQQRGSLAQSWANSGMGTNNTPSGFQADQMRKLGSSEADSRGSLFTGLMGDQYKDALSNFWNANNIASGQSASATGGSTTGAGNAGSSSAALYGTAGQYHPSTFGSIAGSALQAGGQVGAGMAMRPAEGSLILMADGSRKKIEELRKGEFLMGIDGRADELIDDPQVSIQQICEVLTKDLKLRCSLTHALVRSRAGYAIAAKSLGDTVDTDNGPEPILEVRILGERVPCFHLYLKRSHGFNSCGFWSLE
jgi:hypothetical protein